MSHAGGCTGAASRLAAELSHARRSKIIAALASKVELRVIPDDGVLLLRGTFLWNFWTDGLSKNTIVLLQFFYDEGDALSCTISAKGPTSIGRV
jgi:hypothetical protein